MVKFSADELMFVFQRLFWSLNYTGVQEMLFSFKISFGLSVKCIAHKWVIIFNIGAIVSRLIFYLRVCICVISEMISKMLPGAMFIYKAVWTVMLEMECAGQQRSSSTRCSCALYLLGGEFIFPSRFPNIKLNLWSFAESKPVLQHSKR